MIKTEQIEQSIKQHTLNSVNSFRHLSRQANRRLGNNKRHEQLKEAVSYDPKTGIFTSAYKDGVHVKGVHDENGYLFIIVNSRKYAAERLAWFLVTGEWPKRKIQHKNGNIADNRLSNLEEIRTVERKNPKPQLSEGVHYSASEHKWVAIVCRNGQHYHLGRYTSEKLAQRAVARFKKTLNDEVIKNKNSYSPLVQLKNKKQLGKGSQLTTQLTSYEQLVVENILTGWGKWSYEDIRERDENVIAKMMITSHQISNTALVDIIENLYNQGYRGESLFQRASDIIASMKHRQVEGLSDDEAMKVDRLLIETFGKNNPIIKIAVNYYVYGHHIREIAHYIEKLTNYRLTHYQALNRVKWCLDYLKSRFYIAYSANEK